MRRKLLNAFILPILVSPIMIIPISFLSCAKNDKGYGIDYKLKEQFVDWYKNLTKEEFSKENFYCNSEAQSIILYANKRGYFWNEYLHKRQEPPLEQEILSKPLRGSDYKYMEQALSRAIFPYNYKVYHGVEYQEDEFYDQLKNYIVKTENGYSYENCIGKTITSYGFISTSISRDEALEYCDGYIFNDLSQEWGQGYFHLPLKEEVLFEINIPKGYIGAAYLADFVFCGEKNPDKQVLINRNCSFKIINVYKENGKNIFELDLIKL